MKLHLAILLSALFALMACVSEPGSVVSEQPVTYPELLEELQRDSTAKVFVFREPPQTVKEYLAAFPRSEIPRALAFLARDSVSSVSRDEKPHTVVFYLNKSLPIGTQIETRHQYQRSGAGNLSPYVFHYSISKEDEGNVPLVILNESRAGGPRSGTITYSLITTIYKPAFNKEVLTRKKVWLN